MQCEATRDIKLVAVSCSDDERVLPPTADAIEAMSKSLKDHGQISPISVYHVTHNTYRLIAGATRFRAASKLGWDKIRASIWIGSDIDFQLHELVENVDRKNIKATQRRAMKAKIRKLLAEHLASVKAAKGGRGNKGGLSEAARQLGVPRTTAGRAKGVQNEGSGQVSGAVTAASSAALANQGKRFDKTKFGVLFPAQLLESLKEWARRHNMTPTDAIKEAVRRLVRESESKAA